MSGKGRAGKQVRSQRKGKGKESAGKRQKYDTEVEDRMSESEDSEGGGESVGDEREKSVGCLFFLLMNLRY
jgi:hypothetical protein